MNYKDYQQIGRLLNEVETLKKALATYRDSQAGRVSLNFATVPKQSDKAQIFTLNTLLSEKVMDRVGMEIIGAFKSQIALTDKEIKKLGLDMSATY